MDFSRVIPPEGQTPRTFEDKLVQWAWYNSPENLIYKEEIAIRAKKVGLTWWELLDATASFNLNEGNIQPTLTSDNLFFPRYNFGLTLNLSNILGMPAKKKIAEHELKIAELAESQQKLNVRGEVLRRYTDYELAVEILKYKTQAAEEAQSVYTLVSERFEDDKEDFKDFTAASANFHRANEAKAIAQANVNKARVSLEEMIGIPWEKAVKRRRKK
ncbi:MAG: TolC family protein [Bacteroidota bacterium]